MTELKKSGVYTRAGDKGTSEILGSRERISKGDDIFEALGNIDELNGYIGIVWSLREKIDPSWLEGDLEIIQQNLMDISAYIAYARSLGEKKESVPRLVEFSADHVEKVEGWINQYDSQLVPLTKLLIPRSREPLVCHLNVCRLYIVANKTKQQCDRYVISDAVLAYMNRISDFLFIAERTIGYYAGVEDIEYIANSNSEEPTRERVLARETDQSKSELFRSKRK